MQATLNRSNSFPWLLIAAIIAAALGMLILQATVSAVVPNQHAVERHGIMAASAANCFNGGGQILATRINPMNGRKGSICEMFGKFFVRIQEANDEEVTMMCKDKMCRIEQAIQYLKNRGFTQP